MTTFHRYVPFRVRLSVLFSLFALPLFAQITVTLTRQTDLKQALVSANANVIKLFDVAVDDQRGLAYASGSQTKYISQIDLVRGREVGSVLLPFSGKLHYLDCNPFNGYLIVTLLGTPDKMYLLDPARDRAVASYTYSNPKAGLAFLPKANRIFVVDGQESVVLDGDTFAEQGRFSLNMSGGGAQVDTLNQKLYACSRNLVSGKQTVQVYSANTPFTLLRTILVPSSVPLGEIDLDIVRDRLFLFGKKTVQVVTLSTGLAERTITTFAETSHKVYDQAGQRLFMSDEDGYADEGLGGSWGKIYYYDFKLSRLDSMKRGDKPVRLGMANTLQTLVIPSMHSAWIELLRLESGRVDSIDIGETADHFALAPDKSTLFIVNRLGGSRITTYDTRSGKVSGFKAGNWPCIVQVDSSLGRLFVLNEFESSISVFQTRDGLALKTISLIMPEGRTDAIPTMHLDPLTHNLYVGCPEYGTLSVISGLTLTEKKTVTVPGFHFDPEKHQAIGVFQLCSLPGHNLVLLLQEQEKMLKIFTADQLSLVDSLSMANIWPAAGDPFTSDLLVFDNKADRLFFGRYILDASSLIIKGQLSKSQRWLGYAPNSISLLAIAVEHSAVLLYELDPTTLAMRSQHFLLAPQGTAMPVVHYDRSSGQLFVAEFNYAVLHHFLVKGNSTVVAENDLPLSLALLVQNYPNPFNASTHISFSIPQSGNVQLRIFDVNARLLKALYTGNLTTGQHDIMWDGRNDHGQTVCSGIYWLQLDAGHRVTRHKLLMLK
jgi:hypothetical protein